MHCESLEGGNPNVSKAERDTVRQFLNVVAPAKGKKGVKQSGAASPTSGHGSFFEGILKDTVPSRAERA